MLNKSDREIQILYDLNYMWNGKYGERNDNSLHYSCLENPMDRGVWQATVPGAAKEGDMT